MLILSRRQDAQGREIFDYFKGKTGVLEVVERDDGFIQAYEGPRGYLSHYKDWAAHERAGIRYAKGRVLDIGCGAGRHSLYLQKKGHDVLGIDISPLAVRVCKERGLDNVRLMSIDQLSPRLGKFDTILMLGNNFGLFQNRTKARRLLRRLLRLTSRSARIIAQRLDIYSPPIEPAHRRYHDINRRRRRMPGQVQIRVRYGQYATPWFDYLLVSRKEMKQILDGTGWRVARFVKSQDPRYVAIIERDGPILRHG
ncbi:MAG TPA: class I SAM-dependent methyltransferase [Candidatus Bathyarchaeia archaeon]|nr:class I SAM-dependent methyltransferase [Candidatus Bathyarchaeia archaeon]